MEANLPVTPARASLVTWLLRIGGCLGSVAVCGLAALYFFQEKILYVPRIPGLPDEYINTPSDYELQYEDVWLTSKDGTKLHSWFIKPSSHAANPPVILFFQENAGNMSIRLHYIAYLVRHLSSAVFVLGYRGYGLSEGSPSQEGLQMDAQAALDHVLSRNDVDKNRIVALGKSLGGAVALHTAAKHEGQLRALVIENTFLSIEDMVPRVFPFLSFGFGEKKPLNFLVRNKWRNKDNISIIKKLPMLLIGSKKDNLVPFLHMEELNRRVVSPAKTWIECPNSGHMDAYEIDRIVYWSALKEFWKDHVL